MSVDKIFFFFKQQLTTTANSFTYFVIIDTLNKNTDCATESLIENLVERKLSTLLQIFVHDTPHAKHTKFTHFYM